MDDHGIDAGVYDMHLVLRLDIPDEARIAEAIWDAGPRKGKAFVCRCILQVLELPKKTSTDKTVQELHRRVELLEKICSQRPPAVQSERSPTDGLPVQTSIPTDILNQMRKYNSG